MILKAGIKLSRPGLIFISKTADLISKSTCGEYGVNNISSCFTGLHKNTCLWQCRKHVRAMQGQEEMKDTRQAFFMPPNRILCRLIQVKDDINVRTHYFPPGRSALVGNFIV